jgi:hypothetical protein
MTAEAVDPVFAPTSEGVVLATMISPIAYICPACRTYEAGYPPPVLNAVVNVVFAAVNIVTSFAVLATSVASVPSYSYSPARIVVTPAAAVVPVAIVKVVTVIV